MYWSNLFFISCALLFADMGSQNSKPPVEAILEITQKQNNTRLEIVAVAKNRTQDNHNFRYTLSVESSGIGNSSMNSQSGGVSTGPLESENLSRTTVSTEAQSKTIIELILYDQNDKIIDTAKEVFDRTGEEEHR